jgi:outer membrane protein
MKAKIFMILGALLASLLVSAQQPMTLQQCVDSALANNRNVKQRALTQKTKEISYQQARQNLLPNLNAFAQESFGFGRTLGENNSYLNSTTSSQNTSLSLSSSINLFDGLKMKYNIDARKAEMHASESDLEKTKQDIIMSVSAGFLQILLNKELLQISNEQLGLTKTKIEQRKVLVESGRMAEGEMFELFAQEAKEELNRTQAENTLKLSLLDLAQILELEHFENMDIVTPDNLSEAELKLLSADGVYESAISHRPEIKGAEFRLKSSENNVLINKADLYPSLTLETGIQTRYYNDDSGIVFDSFGNQFSDKLNAGINLNLRIPIFNKFDVRNRVRTAQIGVESSKLEMDNAKLELKKSIQQAYFNAVSAKSRWDAAQKSEIASREAYRFVNQKYEAGRSTLYELYQAKNNLTQVLSEQAQAKYEYFFRVKILELLK